MRRLITIAAVALAVTAAVAVRATTSRAGWHVLSDTAINTHRVCTDGLSFTWAGGETGTQPPATRPVGQPGWDGPIDLLVQSGPRNLPPTENDWFNQPMAGAAVFTADWAPVHNSILDVWYPYSHDGLVPFRYPLTPLSTKIRIDTQPNGDIATDAFVYVHSCFVFGPIDIDPGQSPNPVDFSPGAVVQVAILSNGAFHPAANVNPSSVTFGNTGTEASPISSTKQDLNGDGFRDLVLTFHTADTGIDCTTATQAYLSGVDSASGRRFYEGDSIVPINC
jgi:hypothetical protein